MNRVFILFFAIFLYTNLAAQINVDISTTEWQKDLDYLKDKIESEHLSPYHFITKEKLKKKYLEAKKDLEKATGTNAALVLTEFAAVFGDGHTYVSPFRHFKRFPIRLRWFGDQLQIISIDSAWTDLQGAEILKIGNSSALQALELSGRLGAKGESKNYIKNGSEYFLSVPEILFWLGLIEDEKTLKLEINDQKGSTRSLSIQWKAQEEIKWTNTFSNTPLRFGSSKPLWYYRIPQTDLGYFNFSRYPSKKEVRTFAKDLKAWLVGEDIKALLIDFRDNGGGDYTKGQLILKTIQQTVIDKNLKVYVAIGRSTFSAGMSNASHFKEGLNGKYIGQVSGARPNGYQENNSFNLPNSKLLCSYSSRFYKFSEEDTDGLIPEVHIDYNWESFHQGNDALVDWILRNMGN